MTGVIYADVLFILNTYITYAILMLTALLLHLSPSRLRVFLSSVLGGVCSLSLLLPIANEGFLGVLRLVLCLVLPIVAFSFGSIRQAFRKIAVFLTVNFIFAGLMFAIWYFVSPTAVYYNTGIVYFDIDAPSLVIITAVCYFAVRIFNWVSDFRTPKIPYMTYISKSQVRKYISKAFSIQVTASEIRLRAVMLLLSAEIR